MASTSLSPSKDKDTQPAYDAVVMTPDAADKPEIEWSIWSDQVVDNQLNPVHLALGVRGYQIPSEVLRIPERWSIFSPGPPRLQVYEGQALFFASLTVASSLRWPHSSPTLSPKWAS
ncbi:hypothetical protein F5B18DRAFT_641046 [Nemania serpens]|nr:hypothetical protein F5B18DRAFT_641046 [Nemania serpens]